MSPDSKNSRRKSSAPAGATCRHCGKPLAEVLGQHGPFCSHHCKMQDLSKWFSEGYRIAAGPAPSAPDQPDDFDA